ncbi:uncharacterized protein LOC136087917 [Hydra vulgaris]|uniref:Uncharacterized protein LOC136087917 n=1 Tax=Hydra vulgaris TaxID=6087 RepID=A0ABM4D055_HYDVU
MHLFSQISYQLLNQDIETIYHPGQSTTVLGMLKYPNDFQLAQGLNQLWYKNTATTAVLAGSSGFALRQSYIIQKPTTKGTFSFCILLRHIFGFCDDYDKVIYGFKNKVTLVRKTSDVERITLYKSIESKVTLPVSFRARQCDTISVAQSHTFSWRLSVKTSPEKPRYIIIAFQTSKDGDQNANALIFVYCDLKNLYIMFNQERYPAVDYNLSFPNQQFSRAYRDEAVFNKKFYGMNKLITHSNINPSDYKDLYPLFVFDVSKQSERLKSSTIDVQIKATFNTAVLADTEAIAVVISDRMIEFQSDGNKMNVVY